MAPHFDKAKRSLLLDVLLAPSTLRNETEEQQQECFFESSSTKANKPIRGHPLNEDFNNSGQDLGTARIQTPNEELNHIPMNAIHHNMNGAIQGQLLVNQDVINEEKKLTIKSMQTPYEQKSHFDINIVQHNINQAIPGQFLLNKEAINGEKDFTKMQTLNEDLNYVSLNAIQQNIDDAVSGQFLNLNVFNVKTESAISNFQNRGDYKMVIADNCILYDLSSTNASQSIDFELTCDNGKVAIAEEQMLRNDDTNAQVSMIQPGTSNTIPGQFFNLDDNNGKEESVIVKAQKNNNDNILIPVRMDRSDIILQRIELRRRRNREAANRFRKKSIERRKYMENDIIKLQKTVEILEKEMENKDGIIKKLEKENEILSMENISLKVLLDVPSFG
ncbi:uncharacterized protein LOC136038150 [Artemia franciscana]|uniref:BZIP domain-containing protein n=1 Tax=Artemia franciscana TaxID=6661 RepID=A0AA88ID59_ARTSF|nr:hypothetical protein QYM36_006065 [Artemia franciscana]KAK2718923.1 hypothetical protein QYM36_006065 [Artemia franciscana]KAK2718924.1 hypothetical protein QYM36_006065 [Artemia franciscana]